MTLLARIGNRLARRLVDRVSRRAPDFIIGGNDNPYIRRWWVIPRNRWFNVYLHHILRDDPAHAVHDHPWTNCSLVLIGGYLDVTPKGRFRRRAGSLTFRRATAAHRIELEWVTKSSRGQDRTWRRERIFQRSCWSLFITGPVTREWGFHCPKGWVHWRAFVDEADFGMVGRGCGED